MNHTTYYILSKNGCIQGFGLTELGAWLDYAHKHNHNHTFKWLEENKIKMGLKCLKRIIYLE